MTSAAASRRDRAMVSRSRATDSRSGRAEACLELAPDLHDPLEVPRIEIPDLPDGMLALGLEKTGISPILARSQRMLSRRNESLRS